MTLAAGTRLGPYEVTALIGAGGMGEVYRATDTNLGRQVAIKVLPEALAHDPDRLARFEREAKTLASLNHPNIAQIHGLEKSGGFSALVMELVEGPTLADRIAQGAIPIDEALPIAKQIAEALEAAHEQGIIHRDLKPANIKVRPDGTVKVLDFGLAKALGPVEAGSYVPIGAPDGRSVQLQPDLSQLPTITSPALMTGVGVILGTAAYMSPEQARGKSVDKRADIWAFGAVLFEMLTGKRAFPGDDVSDTLANVLKTEPDWNKLPAEVSPRVRLALRACLQKDPKQRMGDAQSVRLALDGAFETPASPSPASRRRDRLAWGVAGLLFLAAGGLVVPATLYIRRAQPDPVPVRFEIPTPPSDSPVSFALSPDGRQLAYVATSDGVSQLWVRPLDQTSARPLAGTDGALSPFWSPDGRALGFYADGKLKRIDVDGGKPQILVDAVVIANGGTWNHDGVIVFSAGGQSGLLRVTATGGPVVSVTHLTRGQAAHNWPQFLPDGRRFLFFMSGNPDTRGIYLGSLDASEPARRVIDDASTAAVYAPPGYLLAARRGALVAWRFDLSRGVAIGMPVVVAQAIGTGLSRGMFSASLNGVLAHRLGAANQRRQLVWFDRAGNMLGTVGPADEAQPGSPELAPGGERVAVSRQSEGTTDIWLVDGGRGVPTRFTFDPSTDLTPLWSPDGRRVVFRSNRHGVDDLFEKAASGAGDEQPLLVSQENKTPWDWSPNGRVLIYGVVSAKTAGDLWALPLLGEKKPFPVIQTRFDETAGQFSPDGRWIAYQSNESGRNEIYVQAFSEPQGKWQVSAGGGSQPRWRRDGRELFYVAPDARLMAVPIVVSPGGQTIDAGGPVPLFLTRLASGAGTGALSGVKPQYAVAADGRFLMDVVLGEPVASPITVVLNWQEELTRLVPTN